MMTLAILLSLKTMESLQIGVATHFRATPLFSMKTVSLESSLTLGVKGPLVRSDQTRTEDDVLGVSHNLMLQWRIQDSRLVAYLAPFNVTFNFITIGCLTPLADFRGDSGRALGNVLIVRYLFRILR